MDNKTILQQIIRGFDENDFDLIIDSVTEDMTWEMLGTTSINGKTALKKWFKDTEGMQLLESTKDHIILQDDTATVDGVAKCKGPDGTIYDMFYADVYEFRDGKVSKMISYTLPRK